MLKIGTKGKPLPTAEPVPLEKYTITRAGETNLSDLYYAWKMENAPVYNKTYEGNAIRINGKTFEKGFGLKSKSMFMFEFDKTGGKDAEDVLGVIGNLRVLADD